MNGANNNGKRVMEEKNEHERDSKRKLRSIILQEIGWESQRATGTDFRCFTFHGSGKYEEDNMEFWNNKKEKIRSKCLDLIERKYIKGSIIQIEFWREEEIEYEYLQYQNFHIHLFIWGMQFKLIADQWMSFFEYFFGQLFNSPLDYHISSQFGMHPFPNYGIPYCVAYCYKRERFHKPILVGGDEIFVKEMLDTHKNNPIEYQVNYRKEYPHTILDINIPNNHRQLAIRFWDIFFIKHDATWNEFGLNIDGIFWTYKQWKMVLGNSTQYRKYVPLLGSILGVMSKFELTHLKFRASEDD